MYQNDVEVMIDDGSLFMSQPLEFCTCCLQVFYGWSDGAADAEF